MHIKEADDLHKAYCNFQLIMSKFKFYVYEKAEDIKIDVENLAEHLIGLKRNLMPNAN